ncbi:MAG TPA: PQQ-like beta-propeller repeat protein, partial [Verrucomicrobiota bacterium]|nr:PQQ-like beta-propeller repeat protein [Verrucomicrobiota bacterium]
MATETANRPDSILASPGVTAGVALLALALLLAWLRLGPDRTLTPRVPGTDQPPGGAAAAAAGNPVLVGKTVRGDGQPSTLPGAWPGFRGPQRTGIAPAGTSLARSWPASGPRQIWGIDVGEGYAGPAVLNGRVYLMDYERETKADALRSLSLEDGREIWRFTYPVAVKRNHGMSRTVPAVTDTRIVAMGPKCHVACLDAVSGELKWGLDLVKDYGTTVPPWYAGQCPIIEGDRVILAPGGKEALLLAVSLETGKPLWQTPNPRDWKMTHASLATVEFDGKRQYVYCASGGVVGVNAQDGAILWETPDWKISIATVPSPVALDNGRIFFSGGYNAGSLMLELAATNGVITPRTLFRLDPGVFGATQQTPILHQNHLYGVRPDGRFATLD